MIDLSKIHNPYDFANPVADKGLFIGRKKELEEIRYYLDHAKTAPRPINIAILGARASGKTSILNMCELEAKNRGFCAVRIDLDEDDAKTQLGFFYKIFDGIFSVVCESGAYEGKNGKTYDTYLDIVNTYITPEDKTFCPFIFPLQYAKAMSIGNINAQLSDNNYKNDLIKIRSEVKCPIIVLFDEGNVLANSRVHLEKLRNIFMNTLGFMLVLTGTPDLFPVMDDVFSPIVRQFKKINVGGFEDVKETEECIKKPLEKIEIKPDEIFDFETYYDVKEIHNLSNGRPYEIQLLCHKLFRRVQTKRARKMKLDLSVLDDVLKELETSQDITIRPTLTKIRNLKKNQLSALNLLCSCDGRATFEQIWTIEYIFNGEQYWTKDVLNNKLQFFTDQNIVGINEGVIKFAGDDFDKIYVKYFAREKGISSIFPDADLESLYERRTDSFFEDVEGLKGLRSIHFPLDKSIIDIIEDLGKVSNKFNEKEIPENQTIEEDVGNDIQDIVKRVVGNAIKDLYFIIFNYRNKETIPIVQIKITMPWLNIIFMYYAEDPNNVTPIENCLSKIDPLRERAEKVGGNLDVEKKEIPVIPFDKLTYFIEHHENERLRNFLAESHAMITVSEYIEKANVEEALFNANLSYRYNPNPDFPMVNNLGYLFMSVGDLDKARDLLCKAVNSYKEPYELALPNYNLGILEAKCGNFKNALEKIELCIKQLENVSKVKREMACLFIPKITDGELKFEEIRKPDLLEVANKAKSTLESFLNIKP